MGKRGPKTDKMRSIVFSNYTERDICNIWHAARTRATERKNVTFDLARDFIHTELLKSNFACPCCGVTYVKSTGHGPSLVSLTIHRIKAHLGYVNNNCVVICKSCNDDIGDCSSDAAILRKENAMAFQRAMLHR